MSASPYACAGVAWHAYKDQIHGYLIRRLGEAALADDLLQDVFLKALKRGPAFCDIDNPRAWLFEVTRNAVTDHFRLSKDTVALAEDLVEQPQEPRADEILGECIEKVLAQLPVADARIIRQCDLSRMTLKAFGEREGITLTAAKSRIQRARRRMREIVVRQCARQVEEAGFRT